MKQRIFDLISNLKEICILSLVIIANYILILKIKILFKKFMKKKHK